MLDQADQTRAQSPLAGVILCCTSISSERRDELAKWATDMGAAHKLDLTSDVTHLVAGRIDTQKYKYVAKERPDVKVVAENWIAAVRESWLQGGETDVEKLEEEHRMPTFFGLRMCITGFEDLSQRKELEETITLRGAIYQGDLTKQVTHLIAAAPTGKKFDHARLWGLNCVSLEWLTDSAKRGLALDETLYDPRYPKEQRGKGAFKTLPAETTPLGKRLRQTAGDDAEGRRKLRRTASTKLGSQSSAIWNDITTGSFAPKQAEDDSWQYHRSDGLTSNELVPAINKEDIRRSASMDQLDDARDRPPPYKRTIGCFDGRFVYVFGFDAERTEILQKHLHQNGAKLASTQAQLDSYQESGAESGFLLTPSDVSRDALENVPLAAKALTQVNEWWLEKCIYRRKIVDPAEDVICKALPRIPVPGFDGMVVTGTSFRDYDRLHVAKVVKLMGATYDEVLKEGASVLICNSDSKSPKVKFCLDRSIPVVTPSWLWSCISTGTRQPFDEYALPVPSERSKEPSQEAQVHTSKPTGDETEPATNERPLRHHGSLNKLTLSKAASPHRPNQGEKKSLGNLQAGKPEQRQQACPGKRPLLLYSSANMDDDAGGSVGANSPDDDPAPIGDMQDGTTSPKHLQELSPSEANVPRKPSQEDVSRVERKKRQHAKASVSSDNPTKPSIARDPPTADSAALSTTLAALKDMVEQRKNQFTRPGSAGSDHGDSRTRQRRRKLGRATSSLQSTTPSLSASNPNVNNSSATINDPPSYAAVAADVEDADAEAAAAPWTDPYSDPAPSQALVWGDGPDEAERAEVIRRLGGNVLAKGDSTGGAVMRAVERIGRVRDVRDELGEGGGVGSRVMRRRAAGARGQ